MFWIIFFVIECGYRDVEDVYWECGIVFCGYFDFSDFLYGCSNCGWVFVDILVEVKKDIYIVFVV